MKSLIVLLAAWLMTGALVTVSGQTASQGVISAIPAWPQDGNVPDNLQKNYVFLGPRMGQIVISYPASLDEPTQSGRKTFTFELNNQVSPSVMVQFAKDSEGHFSYDYTLGNGESARQGIQSWSLVGPLDDPGFSVSRPGWSASKTRTARAQQLALPVFSPVGAAVMFFAQGGRVIPPGGSLDGFHIVSSLSPGFTTAFVKGDGGVLRLPVELPTVVGDQVGILQQPQWDSKVILVLGPRYPPGWSPQGIAADFHVGISQLVATGALRSDSPFVNGALAALKRSIEAGGTPSVAEMAAQLPTPSAGLESDIAAAMKIQ